MERPPVFNLVMGVRGSIASTPLNLYALKELLPEDAVWTVTGIGKIQFPTIVMAAILGADGLRVGMEDNVYLEKGVLASSNGQLVAKVVRFVRDLGIRVVKPDEARDILGIR